MTARPRFFLLPGISVLGATHRAVAADLDLADLTLSSSNGAPTAGWRLLGGNNRELGRSAQVHHADQVLHAIRRVQESADRLSIVVAKTQTGKWYWAASLGGQRVAMSARTYGRQRECRYNAEQFLRAVPVAALPRTSGETPEPATSAAGVA